MNRLSIPLREHVSVFVAYPLDAAQKEEEREMESAATSLKRIEEKVLKREGKILKSVLGRLCIDPAVSNLISSAPSSGRRASLT